MSVCLPYFHLFSSAPLLSKAMSSKRKEIAGGSASASAKKVKVGEKDAKAEVDVAVLTGLKQIEVIKRSVGPPAPGQVQLVSSQASPTPGCIVSTRLFATTTRA